MLLDSPSQNIATSQSISAFGQARATVTNLPLNPEELRKLDAYWRACSYIAVGMIYLRDNPLLRSPLQPEQIKNRLQIGRAHV